MTLSNFFHRIPTRKIVLALAAIFVMWSWLTQKPVPVAQPSEPVIEYLWA